MGRRTETGGTSPRLSGVAMALIAFAGFPIGDVIIKSMTGAWPPPAIAALRFMISAAALGLILWKLEGRAGFKVNRPWLHMARGLALTVGTFTFFIALFAMPLADAVAISFVNPILTALLSSWFLGEPMKRATWVATLVAFAGVLIMLRPNVAAFGWVAVLPLVTALGISSMIILNRMGSSERSVWGAQFYIAFWAAIFLTIAAFISGLFIPSLTVLAPPSIEVVIKCMIVAVTATCCHYMLFRATQRASAAAVAPTVYIGLIVATIFSVFIFGDPIDGLAALGGLLVVASGLLLWLSERRAEAAQL